MPHLRPLLFDAVFHRRKQSQRRSVGNLLLVAFVCLSPFSRNFAMFFALYLHPHRLKVRG